ncbi:MAG: MBL fold metallo-hydrolase [Saccharofermentans sp.]|nr:MBL fold metallo-hydrolase [Saccharofermentans sp.]
MVERLTYGNTHTFLLQGPTSTILVDTGYAGTLSAFYKAIKAQDIKVSDIAYVMCTHYHPDHCGLVSDLMAQGVGLILIDSQVEYVHFSDPIFAREPHLKCKPIEENKAKVITFEESRSFLKSLGISGSIIATPSHSPDSVSVILDDGAAIVGDLEPLSYLDAYSDNKALKADWNCVLSYKPKRILYAHANEQILP